MWNGTPDPSQEALSAISRPRKGAWSFEAITLTRGQNGMNSKLMDESPAGMCRVDQEQDSNCVQREEGCGQETGEKSILVPAKESRYQVHSQRDGTKARKENSRLLSKFFMHLQHSVRRSSTFCQLRSRMTARCR